MSFSESVPRRAPRSRFSLVHKRPARIADAVRRPARCQSTTAKSPTPGFVRREDLLVIIAPTTSIPVVEARIRDDTNRARFGVRQVGVGKRCEIDVAALHLLSL